MSKWKPAPFSGRGVTRTINEGTIMAALAKFVGQVADRARDNASSFSTRIPEAIIASNVSKTSTGYEASISIDLDIAPQALWMERGTKPHDIDAHNPPPNLVFYWDKKGGWFIGPHVDHPGTKPKGYIKKAVEYERSHLKADMAKAFKDAITSTMIKREVIRAT